MMTMIDPLSAFMEGHIERKNRWPMPLVDTAFDVTIEAGLALVETRRLFRNIEAHAIEAALTFPVPIHATFFHLEAEIDGRVLKAVAKEKREARADYEAAVDRGKAAALHEELLPGIHLLSLANIKSGGEISLTTRWAMPLSFDGARGQLRIPLTVGEIYGRSGLSETDDLVTDGPAQTGWLRVNAGKTVVTLGRGADAQDLGLGMLEPISIPLNRPIDLSVPAWAPQPLHGTLANGDVLAFTLTPKISQGAALSLAILVDHSGSMAGRCAPEHMTTLHAVTKMGLSQIATAFGEEDRIDLWEFGFRPTWLGKAYAGANPAPVARQVLALIDRLRDPEGGTNIGDAIHDAARQSDVRDILVLTDGKSHALDIDGLAACGHRVSAVLIGEDSLEARLGHLVAETGGHLFIAAGNDIGQQILAAISALRAAPQDCARHSPPAQEVSLVRNNVALDIKMDAPAPVAKDAHLLPSTAIAAAATGLLLAGRTPAEAEALAVREGLLTRRTSLVLVDAAGEGQAGLPAFRKVALPNPAVAYSLPADIDFSMASAPASHAPIEECLLTSPSPRAASSRVLKHRPSRLGALFERISDRPTAPDPWNGQEDLYRILHRMVRPLASAGDLDWAGHTAELISGDISGLAEPIQERLMWLAIQPEIEKLASTLGVEPIACVVSLLLLKAAQQDRHARRIVDHLVGDLKGRLPRPIFNAIARALDL